MKINSEILTAFTCSAVYDMATSTTLPPASSPSLDDGGMPTPIAQECTTIPVLPQVPPAADTITLPISTPSDVVTVPISHPITIVSEDQYKKFSNIYAAPNAFLPSRTGNVYYGFTSPRNGIGVIAPITQRTCIGVNNELLQHRHWLHRADYATQYHRRRLARVSPFPWRSQPTPASTPSHQRIWTTTTIIRRILLTTSIDVASTPTVFSSPFRTTPSAFRTTSASATFIIGRMPL